MSKRILLVSYHFYPDTAVGAKRPSELARTLRDAGYAVDIIAAKTTTYNKELSIHTTGMHLRQIAEPPEIVKGIIISLKHLREKWHQSTDKRPAAKAQTARMANATVKQPETLYRRLRRWYFSCVALGDALKGWVLLLISVILLRRLYKKYTLVISSGPPMAVHNAAWLAQKIFCCPWIMDLRDPYPLLDFIYPEKNFMSEDVKSPLRKNIELYIERKNIQHANLVITASPGIGRELLSRYPDIQSRWHTIYNGYDGTEITPAQTASGTAITFLYAGSLYLNRNPFPLLEAFYRIYQENRLPGLQLRVLFYGNCTAWNGRNLPEWIAQHNMQEHIKICPPVSGREIARIMQQEADVLINFSQGQPLQIPAKTFDYIGSGKRSLVITEHDSDTARLIRESGRGIVVDPTQDDMAAKLVELCQGMRVANLDADVQQIECYSRTFQNQRYLQLINAMV